MLDPGRLKLWFSFVLFGFFLIILRLFYWQVLAGSELDALASIQHQSAFTLPALRGGILSSDSFPLVTNRPAFLLFAYKPDIELPSFVIAEKLAPVLVTLPHNTPASRSAETKSKLAQDLQVEITQKLDNQLSWVPLGRDLTLTQKQTIEAFDIKGLGYESYQVRDYPEASTAAQLIGFVGSDGTGNPKGYFGLEGYYDLELTGRAGLIKQEKDPFGRPILVGDYSEFHGRDGRTLKTNLVRNLQILIESELQKGIELYGAKSGEVVIMDPYTGAILAMASSPSYDPLYYKDYPQETYSVPSIAQNYEPGSTFKALVMAAAINEGLITPETICDATCDGPVKIGKYAIRTWNNEYFPGQTMRDVLRRSDNTGMVFVAFQLGKDRFVDYLKTYGFGQKTGIDLEGESLPPLRPSWGDIDLATGSFGQGLAVTSVQMLAAYSSLITGQVVKPQVVNQVIAGDSILDIKPEIVNTPLKLETVAIMTDLLIESGHQAVAQRIISQGYTVAGKSGTAQVPIAGHYDQEKTIGSFIGFAPAHNPKFLMLVKLREPSTSQWGMETAAPLWYTIANKLFVYLNIPPGS